MSVMTFEQALAVIDRQIAGYEAVRVKAEAERAKAEAERDKADAERAKADAEYRAERAKADARFEIHMRQMNRLTGSLKLNIGELTEIILMPLIREKMNSLGHKFYIVSPNKEYHHENGDTMAEVDLLLENGDEVMAIEIKSNFKIKEVREHLKQVELLRKHEKITGMRNRAIYAAVAGVTIKKDVRELALNSGMYVITMHEDEDRVDVIPPAKTKSW